MNSLLYCCYWVLSHVSLCDPMDCRCQTPLFSAISWSLLKLMSVEVVTICNHFILCHPLLFLPSIFPRIRVFSNESGLCIRWPKYWSFNLNISPLYSQMYLIGIWLQFSNPSSSEKVSEFSFFHYFKLFCEITTTHNKSSNLLFFVIWKKLYIIVLVTPLIHQKYLFLGIFQTSSTKFLSSGHCSLGTLSTVIGWFNFSPFCWFWYFIFFVNITLS